MVATRLTRSLGNAQARRPGMPAAPAYGNTTNPNGAQTAAGGGGFQYDQSGRITGAPSALQSAVPIYGQQPQSAMLGAVSPSMNNPYPGGDVVGLAQQTRDAGIKQYYSALGGRPPLQSLAEDGYLSGIQDQAAGDQLISRMDALTRGAQIRNPMVPSSPTAGVPTLTNPATQRQMEFNAAQEAARQQNRYGSPADPNRLTPDQKLQIAEQSSQNRMQGGAAGDPTRLGSRFAPGSALGQRADQTRLGQMGVDAGEGVFIQPGGYGSNPEYLGFDATPEMAEAKAMESAIKRGTRNADGTVNQAHAAKMKVIGDQQRSALAKSAQENGTTPAAISREKRRLNKIFNREIKSGRITRENAGNAVNEQMKRFKEDRKSSVLTVQPGDQTLNNPPKRNFLSRQTPEQAMESVQVLTQNNQWVKSAGLTPESTMGDVVGHFSMVDPKQMTSDQKFEAARALHDYMFSQVEAGNWSIPENASAETIPETLLIGLNAMKPGNKETMVQWYESMIERSRDIKSSTDSPMGPIVPGSRVSG